MKMMRKLLAVLCETAWGLGTAIVAAQILT